LLQGATHGSRDLWDVFGVPVPRPSGDSDYVSVQGEQKRIRSAVDRAIARLATRQEGLVHLHQLLEIGLSDEAIRARVRRAWLIPVHRGVFAVGHMSLVPRAHLRAALMTCGSGAFLSHRSAAAVYGLRPVATRSVEVTVPAGCVRRRAGLIVHRTTTVHPGDVREWTGLRVSSIPRMLIELAPRETRGELDRLITQAVRRRLLSVDAVELALRRHARRPGTGILGRRMAGYLRADDRASDLERAFDAAIRDTDIPPPLKNVTVEGWELDNYWPQFRLCVELDGRPSHIAVQDQEKDRYRDAKLLRAGIHTLRITDARWQLDRDGALDDVRALTTRSAA
jgi:very-short-patch-repair endonuclease